jgi:hypothetical protein
VAHARHGNGLVLSISPELTGSTARLAVVAFAVLGFLLMAVGGWLGGDWFMSSGSR